MTAVIFCFGLETIINMVFDDYERGFAGSFYNMQNLRLVNMKAAGTTCPGCRLDMTSM